VIPENMLHTSLVCSANVSKTELHCYVAKHVEQCDERSRELDGLFHLYLVVTTWKEMGKSLGPPKCLYFGKNFEFPK
jgi:hypothetical protein